MNKVALFLCVLVLWQFGLNAQRSTQLVIEGTVSDSLSGEELPFATVYNHSLNTASITNTEGYFKLEIESWSDSVVISYIGYKNKTVSLIQSKKSYNIQLKENIYQLSAVSIRAKDYSYLYDLIIACKEKQSEGIQHAKAYYQLKSYIDNQQIELVENFYNASIKGYNLLNLKLKTGRIGLQKINRSLFASLNSSKAIMLHKLFTPSDLFPSSPLEYNKRGIKKKFYLELFKVYTDENLDTIHIVYLYPKKNKQDYFSCKLWINASDTTFLKIELEGSHLKDFPLMPIYNSHRLSQKNLKITKTFKTEGGETYFKHVDFHYDFLYHRENEKAIWVRTEAVLFTYGQDSLFYLPLYQLNTSNLTDYQKLSIFPHNTFFWEFNNELKLNYKIDSNHLFMSDTNTISNQSYQFKQAINLTEFFNYPAFKWSKTRFSVKKLPQNKVYKDWEGNYQLKGKLFLDVNKYDDSTNVLTASIFDVYESFYRWYINEKTNCFFNMYFDLVEIERRKLENSIFSSDKSMKSIEELYKNSLNQLETNKNQFLDDTELGRNKGGMLDWNSKIRNELDIDNLSIFRVYQEE
tara:strand:- start:448 stop:2181 length:1734 start_codon:yes stop_codon:yes gene_type:complete